MKVINECGVAWSTVKPPKNIEWDVLLQAIFVYLWDKVVGKPVLDNGLYNPSWGLSFYTAGR